MAFCFASAPRWLELFPRLLPDKVSRPLARHSPVDPCADDGFAPRRRRKQAAPAPAAAAACVGMVSHSLVRAARSDKTHMICICFSPTMMSDMITLHDGSSYYSLWMENCRDKQAQFLRSSSNANRACARSSLCAPWIGKVAASLQPPAAAARRRQGSGEQTDCLQPRYPSTVCYR